MENQGENKNRNNIFESREFIHFITDLLEPLYIYLFHSNPKRGKK